tara:strand:- start:33 stop:233 length:201 start_codon:yes stop_codon:yes gene_type:complete
VQLYSDNTLLKIKNLLINNGLDGNSGGGLDFAFPDRNKNILICREMLSAGLKASGNLRCQVFSRCE